MKANYETLLDALTNEMQALHKELQECKEKLSQEPCGDTISRQAVLDINEHYHGQMPSHVNHEIWKEINALPSVTVQPKIGRWIEHFDESGKWYECDQCHTDWGGSVKYCPNCGAKMQEAEG